MKFRTIIVVFLLLGLIISPSCASNKVPSSSGSVEDAEKVIAQRRKEEAKAAKKAKKEAEKRYWSMQSKEARKSVKKNKRRQKRLARHLKKKK